MVKKTLLLFPLALLSMLQAQEVDQATELKEVERAIEAAVVDSDAAFLEAVYADSFLFTHGDRWIVFDDENSRIDTKSSWLEVVTKRKGAFIARESVVDTVEIHNDVAVTTGCIYVKTTSTSPDWSSYSIRYVRVYAKKAKNWQLLSHRTIGVNLCPERNP